MHWPNEPRSDGEDWFFVEALLRRQGAFDVLLEIDKIFLAPDLSAEEGVLAIEKLIKGAIDVRKV
jgi:hypothetical protein